MRRARVAVVLVLAAGCAGDSDAQSPHADLRGPVETDAPVGESDLPDSPSSDATNTDRAEPVEPERWSPPRDVLVDAFHPKRFEYVEPLPEGVRVEVVSTPHGGQEISGNQVAWVGPLKLRFFEPGGNPGGRVCVYSRTDERRYTRPTLWIVFRLVE